MNKFLFYSCLIIPILIVSCSSLLDEKPDIKMDIPTSLADAELLLNDYSTMNMGYPAYGEWSADDYYVTESTFAGALDLDQRNTYIWADMPYQSVNQWQYPYKAVFNANLALDIVRNIKNDANSLKKDNIEAIAYFFRAFAFQQLVEVFAPTYEPNTADVEMGIPLRLDPNVDLVSTRASLKQCYEQLVSDYNKALKSLNIVEPVRGRPGKAAAYAGLARAYLNMSDFEKAYKYADSSLQVRGELMNFNLLDPNAVLPIAQFNTEVLFAATTGSAGPMSMTNGIVDTVLYNSYDNHDLRKSIFFEMNSDLEKSFSYKGSYDNSISTLFVGLTTSEMYLIKAECAARIGKVDEALKTINTLLLSRTEKGYFLLLDERNTVELLDLILEERRKELVFRGRRWSDLKRLNLEPRFEKTLRRIVDGVMYILEPKSAKYAYRLPDPVVTIGKLPQNIR